MATTQELENFSIQVRRDILRMVHAVNSGHPGGSLGCTEFVSTLYQEVMDYNSDSFSMDGIGEDLFFLSNGHTSPLFYSVLARSGYFPVSELATFRKLDSRLQGQKDWISCSNKFRNLTKCDIGLKRHVYISNSNSNRCSNRSEIYILEYNS